MRQGVPFVLLSLLLISLTGCAITQVEGTEYVIAVGEPVTFKYADWTFDFCAEENARDSAAGEINCVQIGGELYRGTFTKLRVLAGHLPTNTRHLGVVGHAYRENQRNAPPMLLVLRRSGPNVVRETGLTYFTIDYKFIEDDVCFSDKLEDTTGLKISGLRYIGLEDNVHCYELR